MQRIYAEGDNRTKCVKLPLIKTYYEKSRNEVITEVRKKVYDIASGYDEIIYHHVGCSYCEHKCKYYKKISSYIDANVAVEKVLEKWQVKNMHQNHLAFLRFDLAKKAEMQNTFEQLCVLGYILAQKMTLMMGRGKNAYLTILII